MDRTGPPIAASAARARQPWPPKTIALVIAASVAMLAAIGIVSTMSRTSSQPVDFGSLAVPTAASEALPVTPVTSAPSFHLPSGAESTLKDSPPTSPSGAPLAVPSASSTKDDVLSGPRIEPNAQPSKARPTASRSDPLSSGRF